MNHFKNLGRFIKIYNVFRSSILKNTPKFPSGYFATYKPENFYQRALEEGKRANEAMQEITKLHTNISKFFRDPYYRSFSTAGKGDYFSVKSTGSEGYLCKSKSGHDPCKKAKEDPCKKKKHDPCKPKKKKHDPCKKKDDKKKHDPCKPKKKKHDPCKPKKKHDPCKKKKDDPCKPKKKKDDPCKPKKKKDDPCKPKKKKHDPCKPKKEKKHDPCKPKKEKKHDPCKPKKKKCDSPSSNQIPVINEPGTEPKDVSVKYADHWEDSDIFENVHVLDSEKLGLCEEYFGGSYQNHQFHSFTPFAFYDLYCYMSEARLPPPSALPVSVSADDEYD